MYRDILIPVLFGTLLVIELVAVPMGIVSTLGGLQWTII